MLRIHLNAENPKQEEQRLTWEVFDCCKFRMESMHLHGFVSIVSSYIAVHRFGQAKTEHVGLV